MQGVSLSFSKRKVFRDLWNNFKLDDMKRLLIKSPYKENILNKEDKWYKILFEKQKNILINNHDWNFNHCARDDIVEYIKKKDGIGRLF